MIRQALKNQISDLLDSMCEQHHEGFEKRIPFFEECQQAAIAIGEALEEKVNEHAAAVGILEQYCEALFTCAQKDKMTESDISSLDDYISRVKEELEAVEIGYQVAFFPYKAAMWDSLESIWKAFAADDRCESVVVPIPYYEFLAQEQRWESHYELHEFPEYVPVRDIAKYSLDDEHPDLAFVHNPYDEFNYVTRIDERFFSKNLKNHAGRLIYVPYYITTGFISKEHTYLPVYLNMDYMIAQSEHFKSGCEGLPFYDRILPLGSPKADRVIHMCRDGVEAPADWQEKLNGKKAVMLNTGIGCFLNYGALFFQKLRQVFEFFKNREDVVLIWRPHPLLESTVKSMKPHLESAYREVMDDFFSNDIGIFDDTPDITRTVALTDAYIGESGSSVVNLYQVAGKPIFILDNAITGPFEREEPVSLIDMERIHDTWYATTSYNGLYKLSEDFELAERIMGFSDQPRFLPSYTNLAAIDDTLYLTPASANVPLSHRVDTGEERKLKTVTPAACQWQGVIPYGDKIFYLPIASDEIQIFHYKKKTWETDTECIKVLQNQASVIGAVVTSFCVDGRFLWLTAEYTNRIICYDMKQGTFEVYNVGNKQYGYSGIAAEGDTVWLLEVHTGNIVKLQIKNKTMKEYRCPEEIGSWPQETGRRMVYGILHSFEKYLVATPAFSDTILRIDKETGEMSKLAPDFLDEATIARNGYHPNIMPAVSFTKKIDDAHVAMQRSFDRALAVIDVESGTYELHHPTYTKETIHHLYDGQDGFEKEHTYAPFCKRENRVFKFEDFMDDLVNDRLETVKARQKEAVRVIAANLDGTCGEKVHDYMMDVLTRETK